MNTNDAEKDTVEASKVSVAGVSHAAKAAIIFNCTPLVTTGIMFFAVSAE